MRNTSAGGVCRLCHRGPTAATILYEHHAAGVPLRHLLVLRGPLCRQCGLVAWRRMTVQTLLLGWWGLAALVLNAVALVKLLRTPEAPAVPANPLPWPERSAEVA